MKGVRTTAPRAVLLAGILATAFVLIGFGATAMAQEQQPTTQIKEEVVVTGTLIPRPTLEALAPVTAVPIEEISYRGIPRIEDFLVNLPQVYVAQNTSISNGASGAATVDLRSLGSQRTLVLIEGHRMPGGGASSNGVDVSPDLNFIPSALVKRVDILTGGASATYGADAVAGVVNFIVDKDFVGLKAGLYGAGFNHNNNNQEARKINEEAGYTVPQGNIWDGGQFNAYAALGAAFAEGKGHGTLYVDYRKTAGLYKTARDYYGCDVSSAPPEEYCGGSSNSYPGAFYVYGPPDADGVQGYFGKWTIDQTTGNTLRRFTGSDYYNYNPLNSMQRPDERWAGGGFLDYEWNKYAHAYLEVMMMDDRTIAQIAPSADFLGSAGTYMLNCDNPMLSADEYQKFCADAGYGPHDIANILIGRRNVEGGPRKDDLTRVEYRLLGGLKGELGKGWNYDVYALSAVTRVASTYQNDLHAARYQEAILVEGDPNDPNTWRCTSGNPACVPMNIFRIGGVTQAALDYLTVPELFQANMKTQVLSGKVNADLREYGIAFPSATEGLQLALGAEYRKEFLDTLPDFIYQNNLAMGTGGARLPVSGYYGVKEGYVELLIPFVQGANWAKDLSLDLGYRYSDYTNAGGTSTWKVDAGWSPSDVFKLRAGKNRAQRAPNVNELFSAQALDLNGTVDPCAGPNPSYSLEDCAHSGVTPALYGNIPENPASQYNDLYGGNPNLKPEIADTITAGIVVTPTPSLSFALDYYDIKIKEVIGQYLMDDILQQCIRSGDPAMCSLVHRDRYGSLWITGDGYVTRLYDNIGKREREGVDVNVSYAVPAGNSLFDFNLIGSYFSKVIQDTGLFAYDCAGFYGNSCGSPIPKWRHVFRVSWESGAFTIIGAWRYIGNVTVDYASSDPDIANAEYVPYYEALGAKTLGAFNYIDLAFNWRLAKSTQFSFGVNNVMDVEPPMGWGWGNNGLSAGMFGTYDYAGRFVHGSLTFNF
jgi:iron complex outermembrane receptor protein